MKVVKTIRNLSRSEQFTVWGGQKHAIPPLGTATIKTEIAEQLIRECHPLVKMVEEVETYFDSDWGGPRIWLYNATGDEDLPEKITVFKIENKRKVPVEIDNPHRTQKLVIHQYDRGQRKRTDGHEGFESMGIVPIEFYPYTRRSLPRHIAEWVLSRDSLVDSPGEIKRSKEPGYEPDNTWEYEKICNFANLLNLTHKKEITIHNYAKKGEYGNMTLEQAVEKEKLKLLNRIFLKVCHPHTPTITKEMFENTIENFKRENKKMIPKDEVETDKKEKKQAKPPPKKGVPEVEFVYAEAPNPSFNTSAFVK